MKKLKQLFDKFKKSRFRVVLGIVFLFAVTRLLLAWLICLLLSGRPSLVRSLYTEKIFPVITAPMKFISSLFPFSVGEALVILAFAGAVGGLVFCTVRRIRLLVQKRKAVSGFLRLLVIVITFLVFIGGNFFVYGGLNYRSLTFSEISGLEIREAKTEELSRLCIYLGRKATEARANVPKNEKGVVTDSRSNYSIFKLAKEGFKNASKEFPCLSGYLVSPKPAVSSKLMCYTQTAGIFPIVFTESIVNTFAPVYDTPFTACHELAHQLGFAREDEANFIGFLAAISNPDPLYVYSGYYNGFSYAMTQLKKYDEERWREVWNDPLIDANGISDDMRNANAVWEPYRKKAPTITKIAEAANDTYLKANDVVDGTHSYERMTDLMLAYYREKLN